jgi:hypothetical protein
LSLRDLPPAAASAIVGAALAAFKVPGPIIKFIAELAPSLLPVLADLLERHEAGEPLPPVAWASGPSMTAAILEEAERAHGDKS